MACSHSGGRRRGRTEQWRRFRTAPADSFGGEVEEVTADLPAVLARAGVAGIDGGVLDSTGGGGERALDLS